MSRRFGGLAALDQLSLAVMPGSLGALIGPNGAGKTTCFAAVSGFLALDEGQVRFLGQDITGWPAHRICRAGLVRTFQIVQPFAGQSVLENIAVGAQLRRPSRREALAWAAEIGSRLGLQR